MNRLSYIIMLPSEETVQSDDMLTVEPFDLDGNGDGVDYEALNCEDVALNLGHMGATVSPPISVHSAKTPHVSTTPLDTDIREHKFRQRMLQEPRYVDSRVLEKTNVFTVTPTSSPRPQSRQISCLRLQLASTRSDFAIMRRTHDRRASRRFDRNTCADDAPLRATHEAITDHFTVIW